MFPSTDNTAGQAMQSYEKILVAVDFSDISDHLMQRAVDLARRLGAGLTVMHAVDYAWPSDTDLILPPVDEVESQLRSSAQERLKQLIEAHNAGDATVVVTVGRPVAEILDTAEQQGADLIVIGTHGHSALGGLLGSTADKVNHRAGCDVLVVKPQG